MNYEEAVEIIVNYVEVMDEGEDKNRLCEIINHDFVLSEEDYKFLNQYMENNNIPMNITAAMQILNK